MPDYAEVAGCSTFKNTTQSPLYDSFGAYATTNLVRNANLFTNYPNPTAAMDKNNSIYSAPTICHYDGAGIIDTSSNGDGNGNRNGNGTGNSRQMNNFIHLDENLPNYLASNAKTATNKMAMGAMSAINAMNAMNMNIIENKMNAINNLNRSSTSVHGSSSGNSSTSTAMTDSTMVSIKSVPSTPIIGMSGGGGSVGGGGGQSLSSSSSTATNRRNRLPKIGHCDKISFGGSNDGRHIDQPLFVKSKEDGSWTSVQNSAYHSANINGIGFGIGMGLNAKNGIGDINKYKINASNNSINNLNNSQNLNNSTNNMSVSSSTATATTASPIHFSSFGRADNV